MAKILIVDDEQSYRRYLSERLARDGHRVETAETSREGIDVGLEFGPDLLIVDWMLGNGDKGMRISSALRQRNPQLQTIVITGFSAEGVLQEGEAPLVFRCLEKPFGMDELSEAVGEALAKARLRSGG